MKASSKPSAVNPYFYGGSIKEPHDFFGREEPLQTILERLNKAGSTSVIGQRRSGKTSLLRYLMTDAMQGANSFDAQGFVFVYMDPRLGLRGREGFYRKLAEALAKQAPSVMPDMGNEMDEEHIESVLEKLTPRRLVLLLDEFQTITSVGGFSQDFFRGLRWLAEHHGVCFITATVENLYDCCPPEVVSSPFPNIFAAVNLGSWTESEFDRFLAETSNRSGAPILAYKSGIFKLAGRFPFYVQMACWFYFDTWRQTGEITSQDQVSIHHRFADQAGPHFERLWRGHLALQEKRVLVALAHAEAPPDDLVLRRLTEKGWVVDEHLFSSAFTDFVLRKEAQQEMLPAAWPAAPGAPVEKGVWVDKKAGDVWIDGKRKIPPLTKLEYELLLCLYDNANCICDKYEIVETVWGADYIRQVDDLRIAKLVSRLRKRVEPEPANPRYIVTVHGRGYKLIAEDM